MKRIGISAGNLVFNKRLSDFVEDLMVRIGRLLELSHDFNVATTSSIRI